MGNDFTGYYRFNYIWPQFVQPGFNGPIYRNSDPYKLARQAGGAV